MHNETTSRLTIRNTTSRRLRVIFEPWADEYELEPGGSYVMEATSPLNGWLTVEYGVEDVVVSAWDACVGRVYDATGHLVDSLDIRVPDFTTPKTSQHGGDPGAAV
jgi:hypothetical protein